MKFDSKDRVELAHIGVVSLLDLALTLPKNYEDTTLCEKPREGAICLEVVIKSITRARNGMLSGVAWCEAWQSTIKIIIFNAKSWHFGAFKTGKKLIITGNATHNFGLWQVINPKIIKKTGEIVPKYKTEIKDERLKSLTAKYLSLETLLDEGLNKSEVELILSLQSPTQKGIEALANLRQNDGKNESINTLKFIEIYNYIKKLSSKKLHFKSEILKLFDISEWVRNLPFMPTNDQLNAIIDIRKDLVESEAKRRVVMGDVGSGKTLVMLAAALSIYPRTAVLMAPTSILAEQIYSEAVRLLPEFMQVTLVKSGDKNPNLKEANLIIGTHVLLYQELPPSPLVMVDEQHRFGSNQRSKIEQLTQDVGLHPNFVQFSATPIPRTLSLIQSSLVEFSFLREMPFEKHIKTQVIKSCDFGRLFAHIKAQILEKKQVIVVYPLVESSGFSNYQSLSEAQEFWLDNFKNVYITYGKDKEKEQILREFRQNGDILLSTTVVEVGISLPRLSTIVIVGAERLGLATLHQLRGRVGRNGGDGYCFLFTKLKSVPPRLNEFANTLDGFKIAELDLKNRRSGDILNGAYQHGATFNYYDYEADITEMAKERLNARNS
ncbi:ATP-dependent DNA helicase RecG [Campylobacter sp. faydin G-105]|uniref:ATP-dependent DNA helicase RecG n=1 Tax=Campylobacter anatolicus TaxID=2829105 RepID=UPI001B9D3215|nr:ATP-dependent DNA helicase RecG [Campylobacter anatolicus]MBR8461984.1 ATP-dependent DNA helicase RecG [Campylobacter anatolicus]